MPQHVAKLYSKLYSKLDDNIFHALNDFYQQLKYIHPKTKKTKIYDRYEIQELNFTLALAIVFPSSSDGGCFSVMAPIRNRMYEKCSVSVHFLVVLCIIIFLM